ncbi:MAG: group 1 truncated hemoglobin [Hyphomicrobiales bacterium]|nr:group 1 truncated hemoglobin [Hyphomicrobiales bacterium]
MIRQPSTGSRRFCAGRGQSCGAAALALSLTLAVSAATLGSGARADSSLYERLGGLTGITVVVDDFIDRLLVNETLNQNPAIAAGREHSPAPYLKFQVSQLVCEVTGGPCKYTGLSMKESHAHLNISEAEWGVMAADFKKSLDKFEVPAAEQDALFEIVGSTKPDIVVRN